MEENLPKPNPSPIKLDTDSGFVDVKFHDDNINDNQKTNSVSLEPFDTKGFGDINNDDDKRKNSISLEPFHTDKGTANNNKQGEKSFDHVNIDTNKQLQLEGFQPGEEDYIQC